MRLTTAHAIREQVYALLNQAAADVTAADKTKLETFIARRAREAWQFHWWPETMTAESRTVQTSGNRVYVDLAQTGQTEIGLVRGCYLDDPLEEPEPRRVRWVLAGDAIYLPGYGYTTVVVWYQGIAPELLGATYSAGTAYAVGAFMYYASATVGYEGDYWKCLAATSAGENPETAAAKWRRQAVPRILRDAIAHAAYSDYLRPAAKAGDVPLEDTEARAFLEQEMLRVASQQRQAARWSQN